MVVWQEMEYYASICALVRDKLRMSCVEERESKVWFKKSVGYLEGCVQLIGEEIGLGIESRKVFSPPFSNNRNARS